MPTGRRCASSGAGFKPWSDFFPWEDWRGAAPRSRRKEMTAAARRLGPPRNRATIPPRPLGQARKRLDMFRRRRKPMGTREKVLERTNCRYDSRRARRGGAHRRPQGATRATRTCPPWASRADTNIRSIHERRNPSGGANKLNNTYGVSSDGGRVQLDDCRPPVGAI